MSRNEVTALGRAAGDVVDRIGATPAQGVHAAIAERVFGRLGPAALPVRVLHDGIATTVYAGVRAGAKVGAATGAAVARRRGADPHVVSRSRRGIQVQAIVNGLIGHELALEDDPLATQLGLWRNGAPTAPTEAAPPDATGSIAVFVHGLFESERSWTTAAGDGYGTLLNRDSGWTPLFVRYNTGLPIAENGRRLAQLLEEIAGAWPTPIGRIALVGHSMGGLVARVAGRTAEQDRATWRDHLTHVACLGAPHQGAPVAQLVHHAAALLQRVPEAAPLGAILDQRSAGIRDLRRGVDAGPLLPGVHHFFLGATITADPKHPIGLIVGDLLVRADSAAGPRDIAVATDDQVHLSSLNHFHLLNHERVYEHLARFLTRPRAA